MSPGNIEKVLDLGYEALSFAGGEPLLSADLEKWVKAAVGRGTRRPLVLTSGLGLTGKRLAALLRAGVTHFHFNFPSHLEEPYNRITCTRGKFKEQVAAIKNACAAGPELASVGFVVNELNYRQMPDYVEYAARKFRGLFYAEFHFIKVAGRVCGQEWLVPELGKVQPFLSQALKKAGELKLNCMTDGFPLCFMKGYESCSREAWHLFANKRSFLNNSAARDCAPCGLSELCPGPRKDYVELHGDWDFVPAPPGAAKPVLEILKSRTR